MPGLRREYSLCEHRDEILRLKKQGVTDLHIAKQFDVSLQEVRNFTTVAHRRGWLHSQKGIRPKVESVNISVDVPLWQTLKEISRREGIPVRRVVSNMVQYAIHDDELYHDIYKGMVNGTWTGIQG
jgi:cytidylate kinase